MNNFERLKQLNINEMIKFLVTIYGGDIWCSDCVDMEYEDCYDEENNRYNCYYFIKEWLEASEDNEGLISEDKSSK